MAHRHTPKLIILGFTVVTLIMVGYSLYTSDVFEEEIQPNNYIVDLQDGLSMKSGIGLGTHIVLEDVLKMEDNING